MNLSRPLRAMVFQILPTALLLAVPVQGQTVRAIRDLTVGAIDGGEEYTLARVAGLAVGLDGTTWVLDRGDAMIKVYDEEGRFLRTLGGSGSGPGEFRDPTGIAVQGDTVAVYDPRQRRLTLFSSSGQVLETAPVQAGGSFTNGLEALGDGSFLLGITGGYGLPPDPDRDGKSWLLRIDATGTVLDTLLVTSGPDQLLERTGDRLVGASTPFGRRPVWAVAPDGRIAFGRGEVYRITLYRYPPESPEPGIRARASGTMEREIPNRQVTRADRRQHRGRLLGREDLDDDIRRVYRRLLEEYDAPETWPAYRQLRFDDRGRLWVERVWPSARSDGSLWDVFADDGSLIGSLAVDGDVEVKAIRGRYLYGVEEDELDVQYVVRLRYDRLGSVAH